LGGTALLLAGAALFSGVRAVARPGRRLGVGALIVAVVVATVWAFIYLSAYGG
jgi:hypothetical protein